MLGYELYKDYYAACIVCTKNAIYCLIKLIIFTYLILTIYCLIKLIIFTYLTITIYCLIKLIKIYIYILFNKGNTIYISNHSNLRITEQNDFMETTEIG